MYSQKKSTMKQSQIKNNLKKLLDNTDLDHDKLVKFLNELIKSDKNRVRFSVDAGVINRLGKELVARHETAVAELVKNAYDADATTVEITFENTENQGGKLVVVDNGNGMTKKSVDKWFYANIFN